MYKKQLNVRDKFESYCLSFTTKELVEQVGEDVTEPNSFLTEGRRVWMKNTKPAILEEIDSQIRKRFDIKDNKVVISLYYPPSSNEKTTVIKESNKSILSRFIISTITETPEIGHGKVAGQKLEFRSWSVYKCPDIIGNSLSYEFDNSPCYTTEPRKGFRQMKKTKNVKNRYILVFDYMISKNDLTFLTEQLKPIAEKANISQEEIENAVKSLDLSS